MKIGYKTSDGQIRKIVDKNLINVVNLAGNGGEVPSWESLVKGNTIKIEITDKIKDYALPQTVRDKMKDIEKMTTYNDFVSYFQKKGVLVDTDIKKLKGEFAGKEISVVKELGQKLVTAYETYTAEYGDNALNKLKRIVFYANDETSNAAYYFNVLGEHDKNAGTIKFKDWNVDGRTIFHEFAHAFQDSQAKTGEDALIFSDRIAKKIDIAGLPSPNTTWTDKTFNAEKIADIFGYGFTTGDAKNEGFMEKVNNYLGHGANRLQLPFVEIDIDEDKRWNARKINAEMLQAFEDGASIPDMAAKLMKVSDMNKNAAIRNARTMITSFENLGRLNGMSAMKENGTILKKQWLATNDGKTRDAHRELDSQTAEVEEPFKSMLGEIMYPGDINAEPSNVYNCRCTLTYVIEGFEPTLSQDIITVDDDTSEIAWTPNFDSYDLDTLRDCMLDIGKKYREVETMSKTEMIETAKKVWDKTSREIGRLAKEKNVKQILIELERVPYKLIPSEFNRPLAFQKYTLMNLHGDLPDVVDDLSKVEGAKIYRGVRNSAISGKEICDMTKYNPSGFVGSGIYGDGTYFTTRAEIAKKYGTDGFIEAKIKPTAKVIDIEEINTAIINGEVDMSVWGVVNGYDVIKIPLEDGEIYYNVLKRSCLWIKK